jgi:hypothetical protein
MQAILALPAPLGKVTLGYLTLFRPTERALTWKKAKKVVGDLSALVATGHVQVQGKPARNCPPQLWAIGMEQMVERSVTLQRPLKNHNYLRQIVWQLADQADTHREKKVIQAEQTGATKARQSTSDGMNDMSESMRRYIEMYGDPLEKGKRAAGGTYGCNEEKSDGE